MAQKKAYSRYFIILQQDEDGYSLASDKLPSGYTKLETKNDKCKISYYVQNLKKEMEPYYMVLVCSKKDVKKLIKLGAMNIDDYGRAEITFEYSVENVAGSNIPVDMITGAAVIKSDDDSLIPVMSGFSTTDVPADWRGYSVVDMSRQAEKAVEQPEKQKENVEPVKKEENKENNQQVNKEENKEVNKEVKKEEKNIFDEYEQKIEKAKEIAKEVKEKFKELKKGSENIENKANKENVGKAGNKENAGKVENKENVVNKGVEKEISEKEMSEKEIPDKGRNEEEVQATPIELEEVKSDESAPQNEVPDEEAKQDRIDEELEQNRKKHESRYPNGTVGEFFRALASDFVELDDSCKEIKRCRWYRVPVESLDELCNQANYNKYTIVYYPMISYYPYIKKHGHYLLGYKYDASGRMKYLVYGVPGTKSRVDQPYGGKSGFVTWVPAKEGMERDGDTGYWLMFYDFRTSTIVIPMK